MKSKSITNPMLNLPHDALCEVTLRLPTVGSTKPWRDVNSLATTCKLLSLWKKDKVNRDVEIEWNAVKQKIPELGGWRKALRTIMDDFENPVKRLYLEPVLHRLFIENKSEEQGEKSKTYRFSMLWIFEKLETASLDEIKHYLYLCKIILSKDSLIVPDWLPNLLPTLRGNDRYKGLRSMFTVLDGSIELTSAFKRRGVFNKIENSLGYDSLSLVLLKLGLYSRGLLTHKPNLSVLKSNLDSIPDKERWDWILENVPECLDTRLGMQLMLNDPVCRDQMIEHLDNLFLSCADDNGRITVGQSICEEYSKLDESEKGRELVDKTNNWLVNSAITLDADNTSINHRYVKLLCMQLERHSMKNDAIKTYPFFRKNILYAINFFATGVQQFDQSTSLLIAMAKYDFEYYSKICKQLNSKEALRHALFHANTLPDLMSQFKYVSVLKMAARKYFKSDSILNTEMTKAKHAISRALAIEKAVEIAKYKH